MKTRNSELLASFVAYCEANPTMRFWQALRNWSGWPFIMVAQDNDADCREYWDTFYWENKDDHVE